MHVTPQCSGEARKSSLSFLHLQMPKIPCSESEGVRNSVQLNPILNFSGKSMPDNPGTGILQF